MDAMIAFTNDIRFVTFAAIRSDLLETRQMLKYKLDNHYLDCFKI